ncbi:hypothetical protein M2966_23460 [Klebsiella pneumoniae]|uniref:hypothetical protein n=1 Tax=Klebsiella/Raoultella group TaxID=2890311 RepID=UPI00084805BD|nr:MULTISPECIES: hypothetical protein [Klebsiella/Raoultella group]AOM91973.1 hypothetical protein AM275_21460 [Klebsiella pneumoniae]AOM95766.1 hypothetical protein AM277_14525 [Klebsiella pneumoniae]AON00716.1 hypothetical protein AM278_10550 [Klebsiella pneumoniae]AXZ07977.1 hypothetical protein AM454_13940 [Klebsiella pneumoniae]EIW9059967.1 hypothetical protein [Klebsiella pneumoniae]
MLKHEEIEAAIVLMAAKQGYSLNSTDMLEVRSRVASSLAAKERHRQRMTAPDFHWKKPKPCR